MDTTARTTGQGLRPATREDRSRWVALLVLYVGMLMIVLDATVVNVALPVLRPQRQAADEEAPEDECDCCAEAA